MRLKQRISGRLVSVAVAPRENAVRQALVDARCVLGLLASISSYRSTPVISARLSR